jgi:transposase
LKAQILEQCAQPGASVAAVALAHGLNANLVHKWRHHAKRPTTTISAEGNGFIALPMAPMATPVVAADIRIEARRGATTVNITWPVTAAGQCAVWLRELLQ